MGLPGIPTALALRQHPLLTSQVDSMLAAMPFFSPVLAGKPDKSPGDLTFSAPVKHLQLWPHQFVIQLDSTCVPYKELTMPQFVFGYIECLRQAPQSQQLPMLLHLLHLTDLAPQFHW